MARQEPNNLDQAKRAYVERNLEEDYYTPDLDELAAEFDIEPAIIKKVARDHNWAGQRYRRSGFYKAELTKAEDNYLKDSAHNIAKIRVDLFTQNLQLVKANLHKIAGKLNENIDLMSNKELISYLKILLDESSKIQDYIDNNYQKAKQSVEEDTTITKVQSIVDSALVIRTVEAIEFGNTEEGAVEFAERETERAELFEKLDS